MDEYLSATAAFDAVMADKPDLMPVKLDAAIALIGRKEFAQSRAPLEAYIASEEGDAGVRRLVAVPGDRSGPHRRLAGW